MIEVSATAAPALALPGAVLPAATAAVGGEGAQIVDFSALLTGATLTMESPAAPVTEPVPVQAQAQAQLVPAAPQPIATGKTGTGGKASGKILPDGKLPEPRKAATAGEPSPESTQEQSLATDALDAVRPTAATLPTAPAAVIPQAIMAQATPQPAAQATTQAMASQEQRTTPLLPAKPLESAARTKVVAPEPLARAVQPAIAPMPAATIAATPPVPAATAAPSQAAPAVFAQGATPSARRVDRAPVRQSVAPAAAVQAPMIVAPVNMASTVPQVAAPVPLELKAVLTAPDLTVTPPEQAATISVLPGLTRMPVPAQAKDVIAPAPATPVAVEQPQGTAAPAPKPAAQPAEEAPIRSTGDWAANRAAMVLAAAVDAPAHKPVVPALPTATIDAAAQPVRADMIVATSPELRPAPAMPTVTPSVPTAPTQDIAALVDRITEARAAAAPHAVRAALVHEDFGSISLNLRAENSHIHVTLGSADPTFAPAVHAAAAASLASNAGDQSSDNARRDAQGQQQDTPATNTSQPSQQQASGQQGARDRAAAGERSAAREQTINHPRAKGDERGPSTPASPRRSGIYA
ncbi:hypothetical protein [Novosphingobium sp. 9U]|uniref:hypothetical protein n=1 Tax=Novosphingobium sp. 9U TaxID=2653158 RepID=UPI0012F3A199|nr:hypothetical protein [Novosphingobium sp. 9U]VWX53064.1 hypothetical protein NOVOSPHI9U_420307 [Novosphingobium sp. 9U]